VGQATQKAATKPEMEIPCQVAEQHNGRLCKKDPNDKVEVAFVPSASHFCLHFSPSLFLFPSTIVQKPPLVFFLKLKSFFLEIVLKSAWFVLPALI
jgi:hypothetical protein